MYITKSIVNFFLFPFRCILPNNDSICGIKVTPLAEDRFTRVQNQVNAGDYILDIGCGDNRFIKRHKERGGTGIGIDIAPNKFADIEVNDTKKLNFPDNTFDDIVLIATINHIPTRELTIRESFRCLKPGGKIIITNLSPIIGYVGHKIWHLFKSDLDLDQREMRKGEKYGLSNMYIMQLLKESGFRNIEHRKFSYGFNNLIIALK